MKQYKIVDYFDVWGNKEDGWQVNNLCSLDEFGLITITEDATDEDIIDYLIHINYLGRDAKGKVIIESNDDMCIELVAVFDDRPLGRLEAVE